MEATYLCPHCRAAINDVNHIILSVETEKDRKGLVFMAREIGDYSVTHSSTLEIEKGEVADFYCPVCHESLNTPQGENLASFIRVEKNLMNSRIVFSRRYGERITFKIDDDKKVESFGESISRFVDPEWYL
ncbi:MAG: hypothetical protein GXO89_01405 [Chlorobi bacterium]|nr:hypothetical protein [Chlorobiota bacterium]